MRNCPGFLFRELTVLYVSKYQIEKKSFFFCTQSFKNEFCSEKYFPPDDCKYRCISKFFKIFERAALSKKGITLCHHRTTIQFSWGSCDKILRNSCPQVVFSATTTKNSFPLHFKYIRDIRYKKSAPRIIVISQGIMRQTFNFQILRSKSLNEFALKAGIEKPMKLGCYKWKPKSSIG